MSTEASWYKSWFDTGYYHLLYQYRDDHEARDFMKNLLRYLQPEPGSRALDLACGRGRHARFLSDKGLQVTGIDLSLNNIEHARQFENDNLQFKQGDMRDDLGHQQYRYIFNLFTSFGYFDTLEESQVALANMAEALTGEGRLILDFMNVEKVKLGLVREEEMTEDEVQFKVRRFIRDGFIIKEIHIEDQGRHHRYEERVQMLDLPAFRKLFAAAGLEITDCFGDFDLTPYKAESSERLIMIGRRI